MLDSIVGLQPTHLVSNTPMKLLTTIAAVLISISAYSQDYVEYNDFTFTQNGEEISMEQVEQLAIRFKVGKRDLRVLRMGMKQEKMGGADKKVMRNFKATGIVVMGVVAAPSSALMGGLLLLAGYEIVGWTTIGLGFTTIPLSIFSAYHVSRPNMYLNEADAIYQHITKKLNQAIDAEGPTVQSPNQ